MTDADASGRAVRRAGYPSVEALDAALAILHERHGLTPHDRPAMFGPYPSDEWKQWLLDHRPLPDMVVVCGNCGQRLGQWRLDYGYWVAMPWHPSWDGQTSDVLQFTQGVRDQKGYIVDNQSHDGRGTIEYECRRATCSSPHRRYSLRPEKRTRMYLKALRDNDKVVKLT